MMLLDLSFYELTPTPNQNNSISIGGLRLRRPWIVSAQKIDVGPANSFEFYIYNSTTDYVVHVLMPKTALLRRLGESEAQVALDVALWEVISPSIFGLCERAERGAMTPRRRRRAQEGRGRA